MLRKHLVCLGTLLSIAMPCFSGKKIKPGTGLVEGYVRLDGQPSKGADVHILGSMHDERTDFTLPIVTPKVVGVVSVDSPPISTNSYGWVNTNGKGHYEILLPSGTTFLLAVNSKSKAAWSGKEQGRHRQEVPRACVTVSVKEGETLQTNIDLSPPDSGIDMHACGFK